MILLGDLNNYTCDEIIMEINDVCKRDKIKKRANEIKIRLFINLYHNYSKKIVVTTVIDVVKEDPDDNIFIACAITAEAEYIISGDAHLLNLKEYEGIKIISPREFLDKFS